MTAAGNYNYRDYLFLLLASHVPKLGITCLAVYSLSFGCLHFSYHSSTTSEVLSHGPLDWQEACLCWTREETPFHSVKSGGFMDGAALI